MQFVTTKKDGFTTVVGKLSFGASKRLGDYEIAGVKFDLVEHTKEEMKQQVWRDCYRELFDPLRELESVAVQSAAFQDVPHVRQLAQKIRELISLKR